MSLIAELICNDYKILQKKILKDNFIKAISISIKPSISRLIVEWPSYTKEYSNKLAKLNYVSCIKLLKYISDSNCLSQEIIKSDFLDNIKMSFNYVSVNDYKYIIGIIHNLVSGGRINHTGEDLINQYCSEYFYKYDNLKFINTFNLFDFLNADKKDVIIELLVFLSSLCRKSSNVYCAIDQLNIYYNLYNLIENGDSLIKSKTCNLIGNMCRHSDFFYESLKTSNITSCLIKCCYNEDKNTRKFACFAIGNAAFLNNKLYELFRPSIKVLVDLLEDCEENTRANAAGALGNFVRCGDILCNDIIKHKAHEALLILAESGEGSNTHLQTIKVALFALGNFCYHQIIKNELEKVGFKNRIEALKIKFEGEISLIEHIDRIKKKYNN